MAILKLIVDNLEPGTEGRLEEVARSMDGVFGAVASCGGPCLELDLEDDEVDFDEVLDRLRAAGFRVRMAG